jgi:hypothetical protein
LSAAYIVLHADAAFTGSWAGIDFYQGRGSTSALEDVRRLVALGCRAEDPSIQAQAEAQNAADAKREAEKAHSRGALDAAERMPGYLEGKRRRHGRRRRA